MSKTNIDSAKMQELLTRGVANIYPNKSYLEKLLTSGKKLTIYFGIDPTGPSLHLGHAINLEKLRHFQDLGHKIILLIGNFTATIGDPTDKKATRKPLSRAQVLDNCKNYKKQAKKFLNFSGRNKAELKYNGMWLDKMNFSDVLMLASHFTVQQLMERDMFQERIKNGKPISVHEFMYPLMQAYDSVALKTDGELGGNDQTFNMLAGRTLMKSMVDKEKFVVAMKLLTDSSGVKMGKTEGNMVSFDDGPKEMFGKIMSWTDGMIEPGFELCTRVSSEELKDVQTRLKKGANPRDLKFELASHLVTMYYSAKEAKMAGEEFEKVFAKKGTPDDIKEHTVNTGKVNPVELLMELKLTSSKGEAKRLIQGGGMKINSNKVPAWDKDVSIKSGDVIQAGKRKFAKIK